MTVIVKTARTADILTLGQVKAHLRIDIEDDDEQLARMVEAAITHAERYTGRAIGSQVLTLLLDEWSDCIELPYPPVATVDEVRYLDSAGASQTVDAADYRADVNSVPARLTPAYSLSWPAARAVTNAIEVDYTTGYTAVPEEIIQAMLLMIGHWYENREDVVIGTGATVVPMSSTYLLDHYRILPI